MTRTACFACTAFLITACTGGSPVPDRVVAVKPVTGNTNYSVGGRSGYAVFWFHAPRAGDYRVQTSYLGAGGPDRVLAIGSGVGGRIASFVLGLLLGIGLVFMAILAGTAIAVVTFVLRANAGKPASD